MFEAFVPKITLPAGKESRRAGGGIGIICNGQVMLFDGFEGGEPTNGMKAWLAENDVSTVDVAVLSHIHYDHYNGLLQIADDSRFHIKQVLMYDPLTLKHGCDGSDNGRALQDDIDRAYKFIRQMQSHGTKVNWLDKGGVVKCGDTTWKVYRNQPRHFTEDDNGNAYAFVNNGSLVLCSPEVQLLFGGDGCVDLEDAIAYFNQLIIAMYVLHHGNNCPESDAKAAKEAGVILMWETNVERNGAGTTGFTQYGSRRVRQQGIPVWMQNQPIYITAANGKITFRQGDKTVTATVPYDGIATGWQKDDKGWYYILDDGERAVGWHQLKWSKGVSWFLFGGDGYMLTGWQFAKWSGGENWFYLDPVNGDMKTGWVYVGGCWYYLNPDTGAMQTGWLKWDGKWCYLEPDPNKNQGHCYVSCTATIDGVTYRFDKDGYATEIAAKSTLNGVDIASYQSTIDASRLATTDFVIVKFTQGTGYLNPYADRQYSTAKAAGKLRGAYHYAEGKDPEEEAQHFVSSLGNRVGDCILALDWEGNQNRLFGTGKDVAWCKIFLDTVYEQTGIRPLIYMSKSVCRKYNWSSVAANYPLWCAQYKSNSITDYQSSPWTDSNGFGAWERDTIRQYSSHGRIAGYDANIDLDLAYMTADQWRAMAGGKVQTEKNPIDIAISIAESYLGYHEGANNKTIFGDTMHKIQPSNMDLNAPWCDAFVDFVILKTCEHFGKGAEAARMVLCGDFDDYTYNSVSLYKKAGRWSNTPHRGDQIFFGGSGHTGIVTSVESGTVHTIEGNKGDEVRRGSYSVNSPSIIGYGRPRYDLITGKITAADMPLVKKGSKGEAVKKLQEILNGKGYKLTVDGDFGSKTDAAVRAYQKANHLEVDGEVGEKTWASLLMV